MSRVFVAVCFLVLLVMATSVARAQELAWAKRLGGTAFDVGEGVTVDASGNVYTVGRFNGTADFDPGPGTFNLTPAGDVDTFVSKLDGAGNFVWAKRLGGTNGDNAFGVAVDAGGNVHTVGYFRDTADFDPGPGTFNLTAAQTDMFVSKLDSAGNFAWAKQLGGTSFDVASDVAVDASGNVYTVGHFRGTADFDPGPGTFNLTSAGTDDDGVVSKLDSAGNFVWAKQLDGTGFDEPRRVAIGPGGDIHIVGRFEGTTDFDPGPGTFNLTSLGGAEAFISTLDSAGNFLWAKRLGGASQDFALDVAVDASGNVHTVGMFEGTADFDPGPGTHNLTSAGLDDAFISKLDSAGNFLWAKRLGGTSDDSAWGVAVGGTGNVYTVGRFQDTADFDPGPGISSMTSAGSNDVFISELDSAGNFGWAVRAGSTADDSALGVGVAGGVYTMGYFQDTADFDPGPGTSNLMSAGIHDVFVAKFDESGGAGAVPDGGSVPGTPLTIGKVHVVNLALQWGSSCRVSDTDYAIYEGDLASFTSHVPVLCSTGGSTSAGIVPMSGNRYYLVVPRTESREGSYGASSFVERPPSTLACLPQSIDSCTPCAGTPGADHLVISQIQITGDGGTLAGDEFVEIYNPTSSPISLNGKSLQYKRNTEPPTYLVHAFGGAAGNVPAHGWFLVAGSAYNGSVPADQVNTAFPLVPTLGSVFLVNDTIQLSGACSTSASIIDEVAYGTGNCPEGTAASEPAPDNSILRRPAGGCGNGTDTDNNAADFTPQVPSTPRNTNSTPEP